MNVQISFHKPVRMISVRKDLLERRDAEERARNLSERLINAQEQERRRIARELHDDLNQRLALLSIEMDLLSQMPLDRGTELRARLQQAALQIAELSSDLHKISYQLHPAKLDQLGLAAAARGFCRELSQQSGIKIGFAESHTPPSLPPDVALCIYRLIQEALQNVVRHSGASSAQVELQFEGSNLKLTVTDSGAGFDPNAASRKGGLGLISMEERVRLVHGTLDILSRSGYGTRIAATVPTGRMPTTNLNGSQLSEKYEQTARFAGG